MPLSNRAIPFHFAPIVVNTTTQCDDNVVAKTTRGNRKGSKSAWAYHVRSNVVISPEWGKALATLYVATVALALVFGMAGWLLLWQPNNTMHHLMTVFAIGHLWPSMLAFATTRFRLPVMPLFIAGSAYLCISLLPTWRNATLMRKALVIAAAFTFASMVFSQLSRALSSGWV